MAADASTHEHKSTNNSVNRQAGESPARPQRSQQAAASAKSTKNSGNETPAAAASAAEASHKKVTVVRSEAGKKALEQMNAPKDKLGAWAAGPPKALFDSPVAVVQPARPKITIIRPAKSVPKVSPAATAAKDTPGHAELLKRIEDEKRTQRRAAKAARKSKSPEERASNQEKQTSRAARNDKQKAERRRQNKVFVAYSKWHGNDVNQKGQATQRTRRNEKLRDRQPKYEDKARARQARKKEIQKMNLSDRGQGKTRPYRTPAERRNRSNKKNFTLFHNALMSRRQPQMTDKNAVRMAENVIRLVFLYVAPPDVSKKFWDKTPVRSFGEWANEKGRSLDEKSLGGLSKNLYYLIPMAQEIVKRLKNVPSHVLVRAQDNALAPMLGNSYKKIMYDLEGDLQKLAGKTDDKSVLTAQLIKLLLQMQGIEPNPGPFQADFLPGGLSRKLGVTISSLLQGVATLEQYRSLVKELNYVPKELLDRPYVPFPYYLQMTISKAMHERLFGVLLKLVGCSKISRNQYHKFTKPVNPLVSSDDRRLQEQILHDFDQSEPIINIVPYVENKLVTKFEYDHLINGVNPYSLEPTEECRAWEQKQMIAGAKDRAVMEFAGDPKEMILRAFNNRYKPAGDHDQDAAPKEHPGANAPTKPKKLKIVRAAKSEDISKTDDRDDPQTTGQLVPPQGKDKPAAPTISVQQPGGAQKTIVCNALPAPSSESACRNAPVAPTCADACDDEGSEPIPPVDGMLQSGKTASQPEEECVVTTSCQAPITPPPSPSVDAAPVVQEIERDDLYGLSADLQNRILALERADDQCPQETVTYVPPDARKPDKEYVFHGRFLGLESTFNANDPFVRVTVFGEAWSHDADGSVKVLRVTRRMQELAARAAPCSDRNIRFVNLMALLGHDQVLADQMHEWTCREIQDFAEEKMLISFLLTGCIYSSGDVKLLPMVDSVRTIRYECDPVSPEVISHVDKYAIIDRDLICNIRAEHCANRVAPLWLAGFTTYQPSITSVNNIYAFLYKRILAPALPVDKAVLTQLEGLADQLIDEIINRTENLAVPSEYELFEHAVRNRPLKKREQFWKGYKDWHEDPENTLKRYCSQQYTGFFKNEISATETKKPPRGIFCLKAEFRGVQVAAMSRILYLVEYGTRACNVKGLTHEQIRQKLISKFSGVGDVHETDFKSFESCETSVIKHACENRVFLGLAQTPLERQFIQRALERKTVYVRGSGYRVPHQPHIRMSGDYWTSLGNLITNIIVLAYINQKPVSWVLDTAMVEGDDGVSLATETTEVLEERAVRCGMRLTLSRGPWNQLSFCGNHFEEHDGELRLVRNPDKIMCQLNSIHDANPCTRNDDIILQRAKAICDLACDWTPRASVWASVIERASQPWKVTIEWLIDHDLMREYAPFRPESSIPPFLLTDSDSLWAARVCWHERAAGSYISYMDLMHMLRDAREILRTNDISRPVFCPWNPPANMPAEEYQEGLRNRYFRHILGFIPARTNRTGGLPRLCLPSTTVVHKGTTIRAGYGPVGGMLSKYAVPLACTGVAALAYAAITGRPPTEPFVFAAKACFNVVKAAVSTVAPIPRLIRSVGWGVLSNINRALRTRNVNKYAEHVRRWLLYAKNLPALVSRAGVALRVVNQSFSSLHKAALEIVPDFHIAMTNIGTLCNRTPTPALQYRPYWDPLGHYA